MCTHEKSLDQALESGRKFLDQTRKARRKGLPLPSTTGKSSPLQKAKTRIVNVVKNEAYTRNCKVSHDGKKVAYLYLGQKLVTVKKEIAGTIILEDTLKKETAEYMKIYIRGGSSPSVVKNTITREFQWSPDSNRIAYLQLPGPYEVGEKHIFVIDAPERKLRRGAPLKARKIYTSPGHLRGLEWGLQGRYLYTIETITRVLPGFRRQLVHRLIRVEADRWNSAPKVLRTTRNNLFFFMPPVSYFELTGKPLERGRDYPILYGTPKGFYVISKEGGPREKLLSLSARNCDNTEWSVDLTKVAMVFRGFTYPEEKSAKGVGVLDLRAKKMVWLSGDENVHTLWWAPDVVDKNGQRLYSPLAFCNRQRLWIYHYFPQRDEYVCKVQIWRNPAPCELVLQARISKANPGYSLQITVRNVGPGPSSPTMLRVEQDGNVQFRPVPALLSKKEVQLSGISLPAEGGAVRIVLDPEKKLEREVSVANNRLELNYPLEEGVVRPKVSPPEVVVAELSTPLDSITGFYWHRYANDGVSMLVSLGRYLYFLQREGGKLELIPVMEAPKGAFYGRPKMFGEKILVNSYQRYSRGDYRRK
ncbi:MAG: hypothetical protein D6805_05370 [Planctomycetota bacterium]|nr:MAG: hypothetical protein D6805_05370 [Planctomycetota bacterium]